MTKCRGNEERLQNEAIATVRSLIMRLTSVDQSIDGIFTRIVYGIRGRGVLSRPKSSKRVKLK
jgi:hypothetical protein